MICLQCQCDLTEDTVAVDRGWDLIWCRSCVSRCWCCQELAPKIEEQPDNADHLVCEACERTCFDEAIEENVSCAEKKGPLSRPKKRTAV